MSKSIYDYIHEYDYMDAALESASALEKGVIVATFEYENDLQAINKKVMFENGDYDVLLEEAEDNFFAKIGKLIAAFLEKIKEFIQSISEKFFGKKERDDREKTVMLAQKFMKSDSKFSAEVMEMLKDDKCNMHDLAAFCKDYQEVVKAIEASETQEEAEKWHNKLIKKWESSAPRAFVKSAGSFGLDVKNASSSITGPLGIIKETQNVIKGFKKD